MTAIEFALNPDLTRGRALSDREKRRRIHALRGISITNSEAFYPCIY